MRLPLEIKMDPNRVFFLCLIVHLSFTSCLTATLNPKNTWNLNLNSQDQLKTSDEKATTSKIGFDQDTTTEFKFETPGSSAVAPPNLKYGLKSDPSTDFPPKGFRIPINAEAKLEIESKLEKLGVTSMDVDVGNIKKDEMKPTSSAPVIFDPFHLIQAEQNMMMKKLAPPPLVHKNKDETSNSEGIPLSTQYSINTEKISEAPFGFLSLYESTPKRKISMVENADKPSNAVHNYLGFSGNSSRIFTSSQSMLSQRSKLHASEELKVDLTTSASKSTVPVNFKPVEPNFVKSQKYSKGQKDTPSEKLPVRSGIVQESTRESLGISWNPTQLPLAESTTNGIQLKLIPLEKRNKDALTLGEKKDKVNVSDALLPVLDSTQLKAQETVASVPQIEQSSHKEASRIEVSGNWLENIMLLPKEENSEAKFRSEFQLKSNEPTLSPETLNTPTSAFNSGTKEEVIDAGGVIPKGTVMAFINSSGDKKISDENIGDTKREFGSKEGLGTKSDGSIKSEKTIGRKTEDIIGKNQDVFVRSSMSTSLPDIIYRENKVAIKTNPTTKPSSRGDFEIKGEKSLVSGQISKSRVEDVTRSVPVVSVASSSSTPSTDMKYRGNVKLGDLKMNANTKYSSKGKESKGDAVFETEHISDAPTIIPAVSVASFINTEIKGIQNSKETVDVKMITETKPAVKEELERKGDGGLQLAPISENKVEVVTRNNKAYTAGSLVSTHFPDVYYTKNDNVIDGKINKDLKIDADIGSKNLGQAAGHRSEGIAILNTSSGSKVEEVTKITPAVSAEPMMSTSFPEIQYKRDDKLEAKMNAYSEFSSIGMLKAGGNLLQLGRISESKRDDVILTTSESSSGSVKSKGVLVQQPKVFQQQGV